MRNLPVRSLAFVLGLTIMLVVSVESQSCLGFTIEGFGSNTTGGCGGVNLVVDTLSDVADSSATTASGLLTNKGTDGKISFREALRVSGTRIVTFSVSGDIVLNSALEITAGNLTVDGSSAPNQGVQVRGNGVYVATGNVIIRYTRFRAGTASNNPDTLRIIGSSASNVVIDHVSAQLGDDGDIDITNGANNVTVQWSILGNSLGTGANLIKYGTNRITMHHNLLAHGITRNPHLANGDTELINNVIYRNSTSFNFFENLTPIAPGAVGDGDGPPPIRLNFIGNFYKPGNLESSSTSKKQLYLYGGRPLSSQSLAYFQGNIGPGRPNDTLPESDIYAQAESPSFPVSFSRITFTGFQAVTFTDAVTAYNTVVGPSSNYNVGANLPCSDTLDKGVIDGVRSGTGTPSFTYPDLTQACEGGSTPTPTPTPMPEPTPEPTPEPSPEPTPEPTPKCPPGWRRQGRC